MRIGYLSRSELSFQTNVVSFSLSKMCNHILFSCITDIQGQQPAMPHT